MCDYHYTMKLPPDAPQETTPHLDQQAPRENAQGSDEPERRESARRLDAARHGVGLEAPHHSDEFDRDSGEKDPARPGANEYLARRWLRPRT